MVGDSLASDTAIGEAVITEGQQHLHRELAVGWAGWRDRLQHNDPHDVKMGRMGCQVLLQFKGIRLTARHSTFSAGACIAEEVALAAVAGTLKVPAASGEVTRVCSGENLVREQL